jgi:Rrf2 family transcriptional regulator, nitric oxide-sensitive transcriptional repressor
MQLTLYTDYSLRVLIYLSRMPTPTATISEISEFYNISRNHLVKVVNHLVLLGFIVSRRGKGGGIKLARKPEQIGIGEIVSKTEPNFHMVECFNEKTNQCVITGTCQLKGIINQGMQAFFKVLKNYTLVDAASHLLTQQISDSGSKRVKRNSSASN